MHRIILFLLFILVASILKAQAKHDYNWIIGYDTSSLDNVGNAIRLDFNHDPRMISSIQTVSGFSSHASNTSMSDAEGNFLFYTSGCYVVNAAGNIMENGDSINPGIIQQYGCPGGSSINKYGAMAIPWPDSPFLYLLFITDYHSIDFDTTGDPFVNDRGAALNLYYNVIDMRLGGGLGTVTQKNQIAIHDTIATTPVEAVRHGNGRDWWIMVPVTRSDCYYVMLVDPEGLHAPILQCTGLSWNKFESAASAFSPDGSKYVRYNTRNGMYIYDFDNTTGLLTWNTHLPFDGWFNTSAVGAAFSPNSRYLYISRYHLLHQLDMQAEDIWASLTLVGFNDQILDPFYPSAFSSMALAPDQKIYISGTSTHTNIHVIHRPDCPGLYSLAEVRGVALPAWNYFSMPKLPHYRNQASDSPCDSMTMITYSPILENQQGAVVFPNPARETVWLYLKTPAHGDIRWMLFDLSGTLVQETTLSSGGDYYPMDIGHLPRGIFFYRIVSDRDGFLGSGKLILGF